MVLLWCGSDRPPGGLFMREIARPDRLNISSGSRGGQGASPDWLSNARGHGWSQDQRKGRGDRGATMILRGLAQRSGRAIRLCGHWLPARQSSAANCVFWGLIVRHIAAGIATATVPFGCRRRAAWLRAVRAIRPCFLPCAPAVRRPWYKEIRRQSGGAQ
jgi:hypothetical protein